jgi:hypothetical protein
VSGLRPFFLYFGGKWRSATRYPAPQHRRLVEPFAGGAGYSLRHPHLDVLLVEKNACIAAVWAYLIGVGETEMRSLPVLQRGQHVDEITWPCPEARDLVGLWINPGGSSPRRTAGNWTAEGRAYPFNTWGAPVIDRLARQLGAIRHWQIIEGDYSLATDDRASWFIDPPYQLMGKNYPCGADEIDFAQLSEWCRSRRGQVMVCEATGANWLDFKPFGAFKSGVVNRTGPRSAEALWMNEWPGSALWLPAKAAS